MRLLVLWRGPCIVGRAVFALAAKGVGARFAPIARGITLPYVDFLVNRPFVLAVASEQGSKLVPLLTALLTGANWTYTVASTDGEAAPDRPAEMSQPVGTVQTCQPSDAITLRQMEKTAATPKNGIGSLLS